MADKFPLVVDGTAIKELPNGDNLELTGSNVVGAGTVALTNLTVGGSQGSDGQVLTSTGSGIAWETISSSDSLPKTGGAMTGAITTNSTFDGRDVGTDGTKLDGIEASADVTDAANVTAAGALMDSELTSIASVKALNQGVATTDSPTFAGITTSGITNTANLKISGTQGTDGQVLTSTGSGVAWEDAGGGGGGAWNIISSTTLSSAVAYVELTLSGYDSYEIRFSNINDFSMSGASRWFNAYFSTDGGSNYSSNLRWTKSYTSTRGSSVNFTKSSGAVSALDLLDVYASSSSYQHSLSGVVKLENNISGTSAKHGQYRAIHTREYSSALQPHIKQGEFGITETTPINKIKFIFDTTQSGQSTFNFPVGSKFVVYGLSNS